MLQAKIDAFEGVVKRLLQANNTVTTLEVKTECLAKYNDYYWDQQIISDMLDNLTKPWNLSYTIVNQGPVTYKKYSYASQPVNQPVVATKRGRGRPRKVTNMTTTVTNHAVTSTMTVKRGPGRPRKTPVTVAPAPAASVAPVKRGPGRPRKNPSAVVATPPKMVPISKTQAVALIENAAGTYFTATFTKKDGTERVMNCQALKDATAGKLGYVKVRIPGKLKAGENAIRNLNMQTLSVLKIKGTTYKVK